MSNDDTRASVRAAGTHTPTPWRADGSETSTATWIVGPDDKRICTMRACETDWSTGQFIVTACNAHEQLVEALRAVVVERDRAVRQFTAMDTTTWVEQARAALRAARVAP